MVCVAWLVWQRKMQCLCLELEGLQHGPVHLLTHGLAHPLENRAP